MAAIRRLGPLLAGVVLLLCALRPAAAFDTQPHHDMTWDALSAEGFGYVPIRVVQFSNWFNDFYENPSKNPYSGHAPWYIKALGGPVGRENWSQAIRTAAARAHFDDDTPMKTTAHADAEWTRLCRVTRAALQKCAANGDIEGILAVMGISLHMVQDFYTHSNWVEPKGKPGFDGPGWAARGTYGTYPTWFDVSEADRNAANIYADGARTHGNWKADGNVDLSKGMNKDWSGRPMHLDAYFTSYIATRQWVRAMESWLNSPTIWQQVKAFSNKHGGDMDHDYDGCVEISFFTGHWNGNGEPLGGVSGPGGSIEDAKFSLDEYFAKKKTYFRAKWEQMIVEMDDRNPPSAPTPVASSKPLRDTLDAIVVSITDIEAIDSPDPLPGDEADWYMRAKIDGQDYMSGYISGYDHFDFTKKPYGPFQFVRIRPKNSGTVQVSLGLYDDDSGPYGADDHVDISPVSGRKDLEFKYDRGSGFKGDINGRSIATVRGKGDGDVAEITLRVTTMSL